MGCHTEKLQNQGAPLLGQKYPLRREQRMDNGADPSLRVGEACRVSQHDSSRYRSRHVCSDRQGCGQDGARDYEGEIRDRIRMLGFSREEEGGRSAAAGIGIHAERVYSAPDLRLREMAEKCRPLPDYFDGEYRISTISIPLL